jgi:two-component system chemotaxis response regulator CheB
MVKQLGGTAIVQHPDDAMFSDMPRNAMSHVAVDHAVPVASIAKLLVQLTPDEPVETVPVVIDPSIAESLEVEVKIANGTNPIDAGFEQIGEPSRYACPDCHGVLLQLKEGGRTRFRCHTGHAYSVESLLAAISDGIHESLWIAIRALEEGALLLSGIAAHLKTTHKDQDPEHLLVRAAEAHRQSDIIRKVVTERAPLAAKV